MKKRFPYLFPALLLSALSIVFQWAGYRINLTRSMPLGIWKESETIARGSYVAACIPPDTAAAQLAIQRGYMPAGQCPGGSTPIFKRILAIPGDTVILSGEKVCINQACLPNSRTLPNDSAGRPLIPFPRGTYRVLPGEYWLFATEVAQSYDSRYFGPVPESAILTSLIPVAILEP